MHYKNLKPFLYQQILPRIGLFAVRQLSRTYRLRIVSPENESRIVSTGGHVIYASWHQRFFPGITFFATRKPIAIMISQSKDGDVAANIVDILGWRAVRGSSTRGGREALNTLKSLAKAGSNIGHIVDGPRGPFGVVKPGLLRIAQVTGLPILPTITSGEHNWVVNSWDRFLAPKPFSRVVIRFGSPIFIAEDIDEGTFEEKRRMVEKTLADIYADTDRIWANPERVRRIFEDGQGMGGDSLQFQGR